jgi:cardiolipin synthase
LLTLLRLALAPIFVFLAYEGRLNLAAPVFALAALTDAIDGYIARHFALSSRFGAIIDPIADKLLLVSAYVTLALIGLMPWWLSTIVLARDFFIAAFGSWRAISSGRRFHPRPSTLGKASTIFQALSALGALLLPEKAFALFILTAALTVVSGLAYAIREFSANGK